MHSEEKEALHGLLTVLTLILFFNPVAAGLWIAAIIWFLT